MITLNELNNFARKLKNDIMISGKEWPKSKWFKINDRIDCEVLVQDDGSVNLDLFLDGWVEEVITITL